MINSKPELFLPHISTNGMAIKRARSIIRLDRFLARLPLITVTYLSKISIPPFAAMGLALGIPLVFATALAGLFSGRLVLDQRRTIAFALLAAFLLLTQAFSNDAFSPTSLLLFLVLYSPFIVRLTHAQNAAKYAYKYFMLTCLIVCLCGIVQYYAQFVVGSKLAFPVDNFLPSPLIISRFNNQAILEYGSTIVRSNGVFMVEPSLFSQLMAAGMVIEFVNKKRTWLIGALAIGILVSHSGTGLLLLAVSIAYHVVFRKQWQVLLGIVAAASLISLVVFIGAGSVFDSFFTRVSEFTHPRSSGSMRFVAGYQMFSEFLWDEPFRALFGYGAGTFVQYSKLSNQVVSEMFIWKVVMEFGVLGTLAFSAFIIFCLSSAKGVDGARIPVAMALLLTGLYTPLGHCMGIALLFWVDNAPITTAKTHKANAEAVH